MGFKIEVKEIKFFWQEITEESGIKEYMTG
jgi:hypothetical protein